MPEGPEVRREADAVGRVLVGRRAEDVWFFHERLKPYEPVLSASVVTDVTSRGKALLISFDCDHVVVTHNQLYGRWMVRRSRKEPKTNRSLRLAIRNAEGAALLYSASEIRVYERSTLDSHPYLARLGPDALDVSVTARQIRDRLASSTFRSRSFAALLLDQGFLAGIGNYLRSEILHTARVHPARRPCDLDSRELLAVARAALAVTRRAYRTGGVTNDPKIVRALKREGASRARYRYRVFGRDGFACYECDTSIRREERAGRRIYVCPECQPE